MGGRTGIIAVFLFVASHVFAASPYAVAPNCYDDALALVDRNLLFIDPRFIAPDPSQVARTYARRLPAPQPEVVEPLKPVFSLNKNWKPADKSSRGTLATIRADLLKTDSPRVAEARKEFLETRHIVSRSNGNMGFTFVVNEPGGKEVRYKASFDASLLGAVGLETEAEIAQRAGKPGVSVGPPTTWNSKLELMKMDEVDGMTLTQFRHTVLPHMSPSDQDAWLSNFIISMANNLKALHQEGIVHQDLKPDNILIPKKNYNGQKVFVIDYGLALKVEELEIYNATHPQGTPLYYGKHAASANPGGPEDFEQLKNFLHEITRVENQPFEQRPFFDRRPHLRAVFSLLGQPVAREQRTVAHSADDARLLELAVNTDLKGSELMEFHRLFAKRFEARSPGQKLKILFSDSFFHGPNGWMNRFSKNELRDLIERGSAENDWDFGPFGRVSAPRPPAIGTDDPVRKEVIQTIRDRERERNPVDLDRLAEIRMSLGDSAW